MIRLITATPGSGKTLKAIEFIFADLKAKNAEGQAPRMMYSNIDGLQIVGVLPMPEDWRDTPEGSIIYIDEAQLLPQYKKKDLKKHTEELKLKFEDVREQLQIHRHSGHDITFITQFPRLLHPDVLDLVGEHYHLHRSFGLQQATVYLWRFAQANPNTKSAKSDCETKSTWLFPKYLYKFYQSATRHTHKATIPLKYIAVGVIILSLPFLSIYQFYKAKHSQNPIIGTGLPTATGSNLGSNGQVQTNQMPGQQPQTNQMPGQQPQTQVNQSITQADFTPTIETQPWTAPFYREKIQVQSVPRFAGCLSTPKKCTCYTQQGTSLTVDIGVCKAVITKNEFPFDPLRAEQQNAPYQPEIDKQTDVQQTQQESKPVIVGDYSEQIEQRNEMATKRWEEYKKTKV